MSNDDAESRISNHDLAWKFARNIANTIKELKQQGKDHDIDMCVYVHARAFCRTVMRMTNRRR